MILLSTAYLPPIEYLAAIATQYSFRPGSSDTEAARVSIEACEHYQKQSWRNRCRILAGDGPQDLNIPIVHDDFGKPISQMRIDWTTDWLTRHKRAIVSAYGTSPYFEYYRDELFEIMDARPSLLLDFNTSILKFLLRKTGIKAETEYTLDFCLPGIILHLTLGMPFTPNVLIPYFRIWGWTSLTGRYSLTASALSKGCQS